MLFVMVVIKMVLLELDTNAQFAKILIIVKYAKQLWIMSILFSKLSEFNKHREKLLLY